ncbi:molybdopterin-guanine dinucleotide biosynthesis protein B [Mesorhizobium xinjiangense]|uniref:molybdopterin-guanine dinucleotide biosynthesis protein B n=1 Tax=Mesorhizobium xinjiangense TaxID=2678685 RepID=UPI0012EE4684|nr:molybdopterin-guanine dinucleotide biosynthesis protein B [Mesorhizobium xinjiangense]
MNRIIGITGWKNSGKTTLTERLVAELARRGYKVATVKHAHHGFDIDRQGTDSWRHRQAGAREVAIVSSNRWALMHELQDEPEPTLAAVLGRLSPCDIVVVEGYKREDHPKIEARRSAATDTSPMTGRFANIVAIAADHSVSDESLPVFDLDDIAAIADFVVAWAWPGGPPGSS